MTKHNLKQHLDWLLKSDATSATVDLLLIPALSVPTTSRAVVEEKDVLQRIEDPNKPRPRPVDWNSATWEDAPGRRKENNFARPALPASVLKDLQRQQEEEEQDGMARLQLAPKSARKIQLLSQVDPKSGEVITPQNTSRTGVSLEKPHNGNFRDTSNSVYIVLGGPFIS